jgi:hypothetical protein
VRERYAVPFGNIRPALFTLQLGDLAVRRVALQLVKRKPGGPGDETIDREPPVSEPSGLKALERFLQVCASSGTRCHGGSRVGDSVCVPKRLEPISPLSSCHGLKSASSAAADPCLQGIGADRLRMAQCVRPRPVSGPLLPTVRTLRDVLLSITQSGRDPSTCASIRRNRHELVVGIAWDASLSGRRLIRWRGYWATKTF